MFLKDGKETVMIITAVIALTSGITLSFLSFFLSLEHIIDSSVLWYFAQTLMYCASVFGVSTYIHTKLDKIPTLQHKKV